MLLLFLPAGMWSTRVEELCGQLEQDFASHYTSYGRFLERLVGMPLGAGLLNTPAFECPRTFGYGAARIFRGITFRR